MDKDQNFTKALKELEFLVLVDRGIKKLKRDIVFLKRIIAILLVCIGYLLFT